MIKTFTNDKGVKYLFVGNLPKDANAWINPYNKSFLHVGCLHGDVFSRRLPEGDYNFIGLSKDLTEEQRINIVDEGFNAYNEPTFILYGNITVSGSYVATSLQSLLTLIIHLGLSDSDNIAVLEVICN